MKILLAGGGTGGHILPTLAVAAVLKDNWPGVELLYVGSLRAEDRRLVESAGLRFQAIHAGKLRRYWSWENFADMFRFWMGTYEAGRVLRRFRPQAVFAKGGYVSLPVVIAARRLGISVIGHESDAQLGLTNKLALRSVKKLAVAWPVQVYWQNEPKLGKFADKFVYTGLPVSRDLLQWQGLPLFNNNRPMILIAGGSQGAHALNEAVWVTLPELARAFNVVHQTGQLDAAEGEQRKINLPPELQDNYVPLAFDRNIFWSALHQADIVVSRAGSFVLELAALGKAAILVPLPGSANDHQRKNAEWLMQQGAAVVLAPELLSGSSLFAAIKDLMQDSARRTQLASKMKELGKESRHAAEHIAQLVGEIANEKAAN